MQFVSDIRRLLQRRLLDEESMTRLWGAILDEALDDVEVGAVVAALCACGETREELLGLHRAARSRMHNWSPVLPSHAVSIPAYGLVPGESLMVSLAAMLLRRFEVPVVVHGVLDSPCGISSARVLREMGVLPCASFAQADESLRNDRIAFIPSQLLAPRFAALIALRGRLGMENSAHVVAQALEPTGGSATRLSFSVAGTRSERFDSFAAEVGGDFVALWWPAGRSAASLSTRPRIESVRDGKRELLFDADVQEMRSNAHSQPPDDAPGIARWIQRVVGGTIPAPIPAVNLVAACLYAIGRTPDFSQAKAVAAVEINRT
jgi:anthranilate phosphoribosyltransferase